MNLRSQALVLILLFVSMLAACGVKGPPRPPRALSIAVDAGTPGTTADGGK